MEDPTKWQVSAQHLAALFPYDFDLRFLTVVRVTRFSLSHQCPTAPACGPQTHLPAPYELPAFPSPLVSGTRPDGRQCRAAVGTQHIGNRIVR